MVNAQPIDVSPDNCWFQQVKYAYEWLDVIVILSSRTSVQFIVNKMQPSSLLQSNRKQRKGSSSDEEDMIVKNIDTGQIHQSTLLHKQLSPLSVSKQPWTHYFNSLKQLADKLLALLMKQDHSTLEALLIEFPIDLNELHYFGGWTLLHFAVSTNDPRGADLVLKFGLDVNSQTQEMKRTALHEAVLGNKIQLVELMIGWAADPNLCDSDRNTAMHFAVDYGYFEIVKALLASSEIVDLNIRNNQNMTPFNTCRSPEIFQILLMYSKKTEKTLSKHSQQTKVSSTTQNSYESRLIVRNSDVIPHCSRADMVQRFLSLRENPIERKASNNDYGTIISEESYEDSLDGSLCHNESISNTSRRRTNKKKLKKIGSELKSASVKNSFRIASQNIGLMRESIIKHHLQHEQVIEDYDKLRKLGSGAFAQVYLVRKKRSSDLFALKEINKARIADDGLRRYVDAQRYILTQIKHPFILHAEYCLQDFTHLYILTDFCMGGDLENIVRKQALCQKIAKTYICEAALALEQIHRKGMLYRDLKAANTLLDAEGHLKLADFGLAKEAVTSGSFLGSMNYLAPEMLVKDDFKTHGRALDWYSLGIFAYELLHGLPPFYCQERTEMERRVLEEPPTLNENLSAQCRSAISILLEKDQYKRLVGLQAFKALDWFKDTDWQAILERKGQVLDLTIPSLKQFRKKEYFEDDLNDYLIDDRIQWYEGWNYPSHSPPQSPIRPFN